MHWSSTTSTSSSADAAEEYLRRWVQEAKATELVPLIEFAEMLRVPLAGRHPLASTVGCRTRVLHTAPPGGVVVVMRSAAGLGR